VEACGDRLMMTSLARCRKGSWSARRPIPPCVPASSCLTTCPYGGRSSRRPCPGPHPDAFAPAHRLPL